MPQNIRLFSLHIYLDYMSIVQRIILSFVMNLVTWVVFGQQTIIITGLPYGNPSRKMGGICWVFFFSVSVKVLPVTPLLSGVFVHRAFCSYFRKIERVVEMRRFLWWTQ